MLILLIVPSFTTSVVNLQPVRVVIAGHDRTIRTSPATAIRALSRIGEASPSE
jgi:hypothetical protein